MATNKVNSTSLIKDEIESKNSYTVAIMRMISNGVIVKE